MPQDAIATTLIEHGADIDARANDGTTALLKAIELGKETIVNLLVRNGVDLTAKDKYGITVLMKAMKSNHLAIAELLIDGGADPGVMHNGTSPMFGAIHLRQNKLVGLLMEKNVDLEVKNSNGMTVLTQSVREQETELVKLLLQGHAKVEGEAGMIGLVEAV